MSVKAGWYPDPGGSQGLFRYWDGKAWSAATSPSPNVAPPTQSLGSTPPPVGGGQPYGTQQLGAQPGAQPYRQQGYPSQPGYGQSAPNAYANYQQASTKRTAAGWWIGGAALLLVIIVVAVLGVRAATNSGPIGANPGGQATEDVCPQPRLSTPVPHPNDGRVHGGPVSYPRLGAPWGAPTGDTRVPFGRDVLSQLVTVEANYQPNSQWVASVLVGELQAGDGFFTPEQGSQIVVKCILGEFYGDNEVNSNVTVDKATTIDGNDGWLVESELTFDIPGLRTKGELLIVAIVTTGSTAGLFYASIPDTRPELVQPARDALNNLQVDG